MQRRSAFNHLFLAIATSSGAILPCLTGIVLTGTLVLEQPAIAQIIRTEGIGRSVYEQLPDLPRENQYVSKDSRKVAENDTLVSRMVRYHLYVKGRPPFYRLDWKLTLADYLGFSGALDDTEYPGHNKLNKNPMEGDIAAVRKLNRVQRDALVQALVDSFSAQAGRARQPVPKPVIQLPSGSKSP